MGIKTYYGYNLPYKKDLKGSVILPDGRKGPAYIVFGNFKRVMIWNRSDNYALAIVSLADYIKNPKKKWAPIYADEQYVMNSDEIKQIQQFYNKFVRNKIKEDGKLGSDTRKAVKFLQHKAKLPEDGYPDYQLLNKIKNYNPKIGFGVPVPEEKKPLKTKAKKPATKTVASALKKTKHK